MSSRRDALCTLLAVAAAPALAAPRRQRICMIVERAETPMDKGFRDYLAQHGIVAEVVVREAGAGFARVPGIVREARARGTDLVYTSGAAVTFAVAGTNADRDPARHVTDIPVVFAGLGLHEAHQVAGPAPARANVTGAVDGVTPAHHVEAILDYRRFERIGIITNPASEPAMDVSASLRALGRRHGFQLIERFFPLDDRGVPIQASASELVAACARQGAQLLYLGSDEYTVAARARITATALAERLPTFSASELAMRDGLALFGLAAPMESLGRLAGHKAARILRGGVPPAMVPPGTLARASLMVNMQVAARLDLYPPVALLNRAEVLRHGA